jgi:hypothetical protein
MFQYQRHGVSLFFLINGIKVIRKKKGRYNKIGIEISKGKTNETSKSFQIPHF